MELNDLANLVLKKLYEKDNSRDNYGIDDIIAEIDQNQIDKANTVARFLVSKGLAKLKEDNNGNYGGQISNKGIVYLNSKPKVEAKPVIINHFNGNNNNIALNSNDFQQTINNNSNLEKLFTEIIKAIKENQNLSEVQRDDALAETEILKIQMNKPTKSWDRIKASYNILNAILTHTATIPAFVEIGKMLYP